MSKAVECCFMKKKADKEKKKGGVNICEGRLYYNELLVVSSSVCKDISWILDSACTIHATSCKTFFLELTVVDDGDVSLGDHTCLN